MLPALVEVGFVVLAQAVAAWTITYLLHSTLLYAGATLFEKFTHDPHGHNTVWRAAVLAPLVTASLHTAIPFGSPFRISTDGANAVVGATPVLAIAIVACWMVTIGIRTASFIAHEWRARAALGIRTPAAGSVLKLLHEQSSRAGIRTPTLTTSRTLTSPAALVPSEICIPHPIFLHLQVREQSALIAHEVAHVARHDQHWNGIAALVAQVCFFQPLNRRVLVHIRRTAEYAADAHALRTGSDPVDLASALAALAPFAMDGPRLRTSASGAPLIGRVSRILDQDAQRTVSATHRALFVSLFLFACCLAAGPGVNFNAERAAEFIPWLAPSREEPNVRMLEVRDFDRRVTRTFRGH